MTPEILSALGMTKEEMATRIVEQCADKLLSTHGLDYDGEPTFSKSRLAKQLDELIRKRVDETIVKIAGEHILPNVSTYIENLTMQQTNKWGERQGSTVTFIEYLTQRADAYMREDVNHEGKSKEENGGYSWSKSTTRVAYMVHQHLHYSIETAMKQAVAKANGVISGGLEKAVKDALKTITDGLTVNVAVKR